MREVDRFRLYPYCTLHRILCRVSHARFWSIRQSPSGIAESSSSMVLITPLPVFIVLRLLLPKSSIIYSHFPLARSKVRDLVPDANVSIYERPNEKSKEHEWQVQDSNSSRKQKTQNEFILPNLKSPRNTHCHIPHGVPIATSTAPQKTLKGVPNEGRWIRTFSAPINRRFPNICIPQMPTHDEPRHRQPGSEIKQK